MTDWQTSVLRPRDAHRHYYYYASLFRLFRFEIHTRGIKDQLLVPFCFESDIPRTAATRNNQSTPGWMLPYGKEEKCPAQ